MYSRSPSPCTSPPQYAKSSTDIARISFPSHWLIIASAGLGSPHASTELSCTCQLNAAIRCCAASGPSAASIVGNDVGPRIPPSFAKRLIILR